MSSSTCLTILLDILTMSLFTTDNHEFEKHIPDIYQAELQLNKANYFRQMNFFLGLKYKCCWQSCPYRRLRQTRWLRVSYHRHPFNAWWRLLEILYKVSNSISIKTCTSLPISINLRVNYPRPNEWMNLRKASSYGKYEIPPLMV